jgi:two-component system, OmpR family, sensor kinase
MLDRIERLFHSEREFVDDASHALRDPLTICMGYLEQLEAAPPEERRAIVAVVSDELDRMARIVDGLQRLSDAEHPGFLHPEPIDLEPFAHELIVKASALGDRDWVLEGAPRGVLVADRHRLTEAVMNLAHNAVEHTVPGQRIAIGAETAPGQVRLWVRDEGVGVAVGERERIFHRMTRGDRSRRRYRGSGLGLTIVRAVARAHGGEVALRSEEGAGATFTLVLPSAPAEGGV